jgi:F0F1-type ATP synthase membrane subunit b/b'
MELKQPMTAQEVYLSEIMGDIFEASKEIKTSLQEAKQIRSEITEAFSEVEKSISEMNTQVEESIKKHGDKASATLAAKLDVMIQQMTAYQVDSLNKIRAFFVEQGNQLAPEAERTRLENVEMAKAEIDNAKQKATKEIAVLIDRINGDKLVTKLITYAIAFSIASSLITSSLTYMIITNTTPATQVQTSQNQQTAKHH